MTQKSPVSTVFIALRVVQVLLCAALEYPCGFLLFNFGNDIEAYDFRRMLRRRAFTGRVSESSSSRSAWSTATDPRTTQIVLLTVVGSPTPTHHAPWYHRARLTGNPSKKGAISALTAVASLGVHCCRRRGNRKPNDGSSTVKRMKFFQWWETLLAFLWFGGVIVLAKTMATNGVFGEHGTQPAYYKATLGLASVIMSAPFFLFLLSPGSPVLTCGAKRVAFSVSAVCIYRQNKAMTAPGSVADYVPVPGDGQQQQEQGQHLPPYPMGQHLPPHPMGHDISHQHTHTWG